jgi:hypothetical protein
VVERVECIARGDLDQNACPRVRVVDEELDPIAVRVPEKENLVGPGLPLRQFSSRPWRLGRLREALDVLRHGFLSQWLALTK